MCAKSLCSTKRGKHVRRGGARNKTTAADSDAYLHPDMLAPCLKTGHAPLGPTHLFPRPLFSPYPGFCRVLALLVCTALSSVAFGGAEGGMPVTRSQTGRVANTVVVPAYKENPNIRPLTERLFKALDEHGR